MLGRGATQFYDIVSVDTRLLFCLVFLLTND